MRWPFLLSILFTVQLVWADSYVMRSFSSNNGLISSSNNAIYRDSSGFIWICSYGGLVRFDGSLFHVLDNSKGFRHYQISDLLEKRKNSFLICNEKHLFSMVENRLTEIRTNLPDHLVLDRFIRTPEGQIFLQTNGGMFQWINDSTYQSFQYDTLLSSDIMSICPIQNNRKLAYSHKHHAVFIIDSDHLLTRIPLSADEYLYDFFVLGKDIFLGLSSGMRILRNQQLLPYLPEGYRGGGFLTSIYRDHLDEIWFTDNSYRLWKSDHGQYINLSEKYNAPKAILPHYLEDGSGNIFIQFMNGMCVFRESPYREIPIASMNSYNMFFMSSFYSPDTFCYGIARNKLRLCDGEKTFDLSIETGAAINFEELRNCQLFPTKDPKKLFVFVRGCGIFFMKNKKLEVFNPQVGNLDRLILTSNYDTIRNRFYTARNDTVFCISPDSIKRYMPHVKNHDIRYHSFVYTRDGRVFFSGNHRLLFALINHKIYDLTPQLQIQDRDYSLFIHKDHLWIWIHGIALREYAIDGMKLILLRSIGKENGLLDANGNHIQFDEDDNLWINAFTGLYWLQCGKNAKGPVYYSRKIPLHLSGIDAPMIDRINYSHDKLYTVGVGGIMILNTSSMVLRHKPLLTYQVAGYANGKSIEGLLKNGIAVWNKNTLQLPTTFRQLSFEMGTVYYGFDHAIRYHYRLLGQDEEWKTLLQGNLIQFNNLSSGSYTLECKSLNLADSSATIPYRFAFHIQPALYETWWFRISLGILAFTILVYMIRQRDKRKQKENRIAMQLSELKLEALQSQMNPHFIFNALNSIQNYILQHDEMEAARYLSKFSKLIRKTLDHSHHQLIPIGEIVQSLQMYLELEAFRFNHEFHYTLSLDESDDRIHMMELPPMLLQPFVENAILHGLMPKQGDKHLSIQLYMNFPMFHCLIEDNGVGREYGHPREGHQSRGQKLTEGMMDALRHLRQTDPEIIITDLKDPQGMPAGTRIEINIPFEK
ncbi:MAG: histidine kinase [Chitinophagaceae bacterium]|nr:histidine kinase [Chitinophagaceae bacterium]